tara:strand:- start:984 stop:1742 length:759 start_codon:yes stop_codon:yes gene_type:complete
MKKLILLSILLFGISINAQEVFFLHGIKVENTENFEQREIQYLSELAQDEVDEGRMVRWILLRKVNSIGNPDESKYNYMWVHRFADIKQMVNRKPFWQNMEAKFGDVSNFIWGSNVGSSSSGRYFWKIEGEIPQQEPSKYVILNTATPSDVGKVVELTNNIANKYFKKNMKKSGIKGWGVASKIAPVHHKNSPATIFFWDAYNDMEGIMGHLANEAAISDVPESMVNELYTYMPDGWNFREVWEVIASTSSN